MRYFTTEREGFLYFLDNGKGDIWSADSPDGPWDEYAQYEPGGLQDALNGAFEPGEGFYAYETDEDWNRL